MGPSIKYVTLFLVNFYPPVTLPGTPRKYVTHLGRPPDFSRPSTNIPDKSPLYKFSQLFARVFVSGVCQGVFCLEGFVQGGFCSFPLLSEYICYNRKLNITLNFMFHMYDKKCISVTSHALSPLPCHKLSHLLGPPPLERDVLY